MDWHGRLRPGFGLPPTVRSRTDLAAVGTRPTGLEPGGHGGSGADAVPAPRPRQSADWITRTAICVEPRHGVLHIFMPPLGETEDYLRPCVRHLEETASELKLPVIVEGERPPDDPRLSVLKVTPDPGVIEVNIPPVRGWDELVRNTEFL